MVTVQQVFDGAGVTLDESVRWGTRVSVDEPGVYVVATHPDISAVGGLATAPISHRRVEELLAHRPELTLDGRRPSAVELQTRLASMWLPDEPIVYIGLAGTSLRRRIGQYYATALGARAPHAGGWPLKTLGVIDDLTVFVGKCPDPTESEFQMLTAFAAGIPESTKLHLHDQNRIMPFANLEFPKGSRKGHGIRGAREPRSTTVNEPASPPRQSTHAPGFEPATSRSGGRTTQRITATDIASGRIRVPSRSKDVFPSERARIQVELRGHSVSAAWDPKMGPDRERSGTIAIPRAALASTVKLNEVLTIRHDGSVHLS